MRMVTFTPYAVWQYSYAFGSRMSSEDSLNLKNPNAGFHISCRQNHQKFKKTDCSCTLYEFYLIRLCYSCSSHAQATLERATQNERMK